MNKLEKLICNKIDNFAERLKSKETQENLVKMNKALIVGIFFWLSVLILII